MILPVIAKLLSPRIKPPAVVTLGNVSAVVPRTVIAADDVLAVANVPDKVIAPAAVPSLPVSKMVPPLVPLLGVVPLRDPVALMVPPLCVMPRPERTILLPAVASSPAETPKPARLSAPLTAVSVMAPSEVLMSPDSKRPATLRNVKVAGVAAMPVAT